MPWGAISSYTLYGPPLMIMPTGDQESSDSFCVQGSISAYTEHSLMRLVSRWENWELFLSKIH